MTALAAHPVAVIVVAAGDGTRLGAGAPKAFVPLGGRSLLERTVSAVPPELDAQLILVVPADRVTTVQASFVTAQVVAGGPTRQQSVQRGLSLLESGVRTVLVQDAARALTPPELYLSVVEAVRRHGAGVVPALAVADTLKRVADGTVLATVDRSELVAVQTPQGFPRADLERAYEAAEHDYTDDAAVYAAAGLPVRTIAGSARAFKITTAADLARAEAIVATTGPRTGIGVDVHAFSDGGELRLATLSWPGVPALAGHSDGDAVAHAICDALLSAAGLGDIGERFGTSDPHYAGAEGAVFLRETVALLSDVGFEPGNVSVQIVANAPRFAVRRHEAEAALSAIVGAPVSATATTSDGLGFTGRGEGVTAVATALIRPRSLS